MIIGCANGPQPHDTGVAGHEQAAHEHEAAAADLEAPCAHQTVPLQPCWKSHDVAVIRTHREAAAKHRAASAALVAAEVQACAGISDDDRAISPFEHPADIIQVEPLILRGDTGKLGPGGQMLGATVTFRAVPGLTAEWLQRLVNCHLARNAALGHVVPEMPDCVSLGPGRSRSADQRATTASDRNTKESSMNVSQLMTKSMHTCNTTDTLERAAQLMWDHDIGCLPIVDERGQVAGLITDRDICMAAYTRGSGLQNVPVTVAMSRGVVSCKPSTDVREAEAEMQRSQIRRLPVIDEASRPVGMISLNDIARAAQLGQVSPTEVISTLASVAEPRSSADSARP